MRSYKAQTTYRQQLDILEYAAKNGFDIEQVEGTLNDIFIIHASKKISINKRKAREYIVLYPKSQNEWSNSFWILETDNKQEVKNFKN